MTTLITAAKETRISHAQTEATTDRKKDKSLSSVGCDLPVPSRQSKAKCHTSNPIHGSRSPNAEKLA